MRKILNKILEEINKEAPRLDYIRGLIEASLEEEAVYETPKPWKTSRVETPNITNIDEASILDASTTAALARIKPSIE